jgi:hypothetical protein
MDYKILPAEITKNIFEFAGIAPNMYILFKSCTNGAYMINFTLVKEYISSKISTYNITRSQLRKKSDSNKVVKHKLEYILLTNKKRRGCVYFLDEKNINENVLLIKFYNKYMYDTIKINFKEVKKYIDKQKYLIY